MFGIKDLTNYIFNNNTNNNIYYNNKCQHRQSLYHNKWPSDSQNLRLWLKGIKIENPPRYVRQLTVTENGE